MLVYVSSFIKENQKVNRTFRHPAAKRNIIIAWLHAPQTHTFILIHSYTSAGIARALAPPPSQPFKMSITLKHFVLALWRFGVFG